MPRTVFAPAEAKAAATPGSRPVTPFAAETGMKEEDLAQIPRGR
jgi:hypothetical protein